MPKTQQLIVLIGFGIIVLMGIFPPWSFVDQSRAVHSMGYAPIWKPPVHRSQESAEIFGVKLQLNLQSQAANSIAQIRACCRRHKLDLSLDKTLSPKN